jgi:anti-sigma-K factor RskA
LCQAAEVAAAAAVAHFQTLALRLTAAAKTLVRRLATQGAAVLLLAHRLEKNQEHLEELKVTEDDGRQQNHQQWALLCWPFVPVSAHRRPEVSSEIVTPCSDAKAPS